MLARLQRFTTLGLLLAAALWAWAFARAGHPVWAFGGAVLIVFGYALVLGIEFVLLAHVNRSDPAVPPASAGRLIRAWAGEALSAPGVFCWRQPFRTWAVADQPSAATAGRRGVVLIHGFVCNRALWTPVMRRLQREGVPFIAVSMEPVFGSIDRYAPQIEAAVRALEAGTGLPPVLLCHSMGGLAARAWLRANQQAGGSDDRVHRVITIGSPHHGTWLARWGFASNTRQMRQGNPWLAELAASETPSRHARFTCFWGHCDNIVFPASTAVLPGSHAVHLSDIAHVHMAFHDEVFNEVLRWVDKAVAPSGTAPAGAGAAARTGASAQ